VLKAMVIPAVLLWTWHWVTGKDAFDVRVLTMLVVFVTMPLLVVRLMLHVLRVQPFSLRAVSRRRVLSIGSEEENRHALALLWQTHFGLGRQKEMSAAEAMAPDAAAVIQKNVRKHRIDEVVFCAKDLKWGRIIDLMEQLKRTGAMFKIAQPGSEFVIGPSSIESLQDLLIMEEHAVSSSAARRRKRIFDLVLSILLIAASPVLIWAMRDRGGFLRNIGHVLLGRASWVGYFPQAERGVRLPRIRPGVLDPVRADGLMPTPTTVQRMNLTYAKDYRVGWDLRLIRKAFAQLGG
jgi:hypothetical protein